MMSDSKWNDDIRATTYRATPSASAAQTADGQERLVVDPNKLPPNVVTALYSLVELPTPGASPATLPSARAAGNHYVMELESGAYNLTGKDSDGFLTVTPESLAAREAAIRQKTLADVARYVEANRAEDKRPGGDAFTLAERAAEDERRHNLAAANPATLAPDGNPIDPKEAEAERRLIERGEKVTRARLLREMDDAKIERMTPTHAPEVIAERLEMDEETVKTRQKKMRRRKTSP